ncbi:MAG: 2-oxo acid dehydrogenase subunit E2 [Chlamydiae bacterium]|nr:2-oxo acid dehydrogenase subunit E2 [Chlamydiota bacterium]
MSEFKVTLPKLGESIVNATVVQWFKKPGEYVEKDEPLLEVSTDKVNSEIPSPTAGIVKAIYAQVDQEMNVGDTLALIVQEKNSNQREEPIVQKKSTPVPETNSSEMQDFFSPALIRLAQEKGVSLSELEKIKGTGSGGRVTRRDLEDHLEKMAKKENCPMYTQMQTEGDVERVKMSGMRKAIAENMVRSFYGAPHATLITEVDVTNIVKFIKERKESFQEKYGAKLTITSFIIRAIANGLQQFPLINSSLENDTIVLKRFVHLGIAVSVEHGIIVPVIKNCQKLTLPEIALEVQNLSSKARSGKLQPEDVKEGTITLTNFGMSGVSIGIPIIRFPEVAIIGMGSIQKKVVAMDDQTFAIRSIINISLTFDHRVIDGMYGCGFLAALKKYLEKDLEEELNHHK